MDTLLRDARTALRSLWKERTFSGTVLITLAVCIGANVAIFGVVHRVLLEPLPFHEADRLVTLYNSYPGASATRGANGSVDFFERRAGVEAFEDVALFQGSGNTVGEAGSTERVSSLRVTPSFFPLLRVEAGMGRTFGEEAMEPGRELEVVLTWAYWQEHFGGAPDVLGGELRVDARPFTVVGVLPRDFLVPGQQQARLFLPIAFDEDDRAMESWHSNNYSMIARLLPDASVEQAQAQVDALNEALIDRFPIPNARRILEDAGFHTVVVPTQDDLVRDARGPLFMLWAGVGLVFLIGCVNVANLMLARAHGRQADVATRLALGAPRPRVARQVLTESVVMGTVGGVLGMALGALGLRLLSGLGAADLPMGTRIGMDGTVVLFSLALAVGAGLLFGAIPVVQVMRGDLSSVFRADSRTGTASRRAVLLRSSLVTGQVAVAFVLLIGAGLMLMSFREALSVEPGFDPDGVLTGFVSLPGARYEWRERSAFIEEVTARASAIPGVSSAGVTAQLPFTGNGSSSVAMPAWYVPQPGESVLSPRSAWVGPGYFETLGIRLVEGRYLDRTDTPDAARAIVLDRWLAERYWPDRSPLGDQMLVEAVPGMDSIPPENLYTIVGVVETIRHDDLTSPAAEHTGAYYRSALQSPPSFLALTVRGDGDAADLTPALRAVVTGIDPELPLFGVRTLRARVDDSLQSRRVPLVLLSVFAVVALFLAMVGIYGALAYSVTQRGREIGIRMAMGSAPEDVFRQVVAQGMRVTGLGLVLGAATALLVTRLLRTLLFGVQPADPRVMVAVAVTLAVVGLVACLVPARRATGVDPVRALTG